MSSKIKGAEIWYQTVFLGKNRAPETTIETLIPDVKSNWQTLERMISAGAEVVSHNMETVGRLYRLVRPQAKYERSLEQIKRTKEYGKRTKQASCWVWEKAREVFAGNGRFGSHGTMYSHSASTCNQPKCTLKWLNSSILIPLPCIKEEGMARGLLLLKAAHWCDLLITLNVICKIHFMSTPHNSAAMAKLPPPC